jgi:hypothetical protein
MDLETITGDSEVELTASVGIDRIKPGCNARSEVSVETAFERMLIARSSGGDMTCDSGGTG